jgi:tight adherence protein C
MLEWIVLSAVFLIVVASSFFLVRRMSSAREQLDRRLADGADISPFQERQLILGDMTAPLSRLTLADPSKQATLAQELREAGYYRPTALLEYSALQAVLIVTPLIISVLLVLTIVEGAWAFWVLGGGVLLALLGFSLPRLYVNFRARQRAREIERGLPVAVDLLALCLTGGQSVLVAIGRVAHDIEIASPTLSRELRIVDQHAQMAGLEWAMHHFASRTNLTEVKNLATILTHAERLGSDVATALFEFSRSFRQSLRLRAETFANRASFWLLFPTIFCLMLPALVLFYAPLMHEVSRIQSERREDFQKNQKRLQKLKPLSVNTGQ